MDNNNGAETNNENPLPEPEGPGSNTEPANQMGRPVVGLEGPSNKKPTLILIVVLVVFLLGGAAGAWFLLKDKSASNQQPTQTATDTGQEPKELQPFAVAYAQRTDEQQPSGDCLATQTKAYWRPLSGGEQTTAFDAGKQSYVNFYQTYKNQAFVVTGPGCDSTDGTTVWYSKDAGKTYTKVFSGQPSDGTTWDQITSATFSSDGKTILVALLPNDGKNTVKEIDPSTKTTKDLFTLDDRGVFLEGYDSDKKLVYYFSGCYNCDGNRFEKLNVYDLAAKTSSVVFDDKNTVGLNTVINSDFTKVLRVKGAAGDELGAAAPYTVEEFDLSSKTFKSLQTITDAAPTAIGYREDDGLAYYAKGNALYSAKDNTVLYETSKPILAAHYVSKDQVVVSAGTVSDFVVNHFTISTDTSVNVLNGDDKTVIFGLTWN